MLAAMRAEVRLTVTIEIQPAGENPPRHWRFPDRCPNSPALPCDVPRRSTLTETITPILDPSDASTRRLQRRKASHPHEEVRWPLLAPVGAQEHETFRLTTLTARSVARLPAIRRVRHWLGQSQGPDQPYRSG